MNKRKDDLSLGYQKLREESKTTIQFLEILLDKNLKSVEKILKLDLKQFQSNASLYRETLRQQNEVFEKLSFLNIELEGMLEVDDPVLSSSTLNGSFMSRLNEVESISFYHGQLSPPTYRTEEYVSEHKETLPDVQRVSVDENKTLLTDQTIVRHSTNQVSEPKAILNDVQKDFVDENKTLITEERIVQHNMNQVSEHEKISNNVEKFVVDENKTFPTEQRIEGHNVSQVSEHTESLHDVQKVVLDENKTLLTEQIILQHSRDTTPDNLAKPQVENKYEIVESHQTQPESSPTLIENECGNTSKRVMHLQPDYNTNTDSSDESECKPKKVVQKKAGSVNEKLCQDKFLSRKDKYVKNLPKPPMPDLTFNRQSFSSSEYLSAVSVEDGDDNRTKGEPAATSSNIIEIPEATMPNMSDLCVISSYENPSQFHITLANEETQLLDSFTEQLGEWCRKTNPFESKKQAKKMISKYCISYSNEFKNYYRAVVINWLDDPKSSDNVEVQFVDYGDISSIHYSAMYPLPEMFTKLPKMSIQCHLAFLFPPGSTIDRKIPFWSKESMATFKKLLDSEENYFHIVFMEKIGQTLGIDLVKQKRTREDISICEAMLSLGAATQIINHKPNIKNKLIQQQISTAQGFHGIDGTMSSEEVMNTFLDNMDDLEEADTVEEGVTNYRATDQARICRFTRPDNTCFKGANCKLEHVQLREDDTTTDTNTIYTDSLQQMPLPKINDGLRIKITNFCAVDQFYAQIHSSEIKRLNDLNALINEKKTLEKLEIFKILPAIGEIVIAKHWGGDWYRAMVIETDSSEYTLQVIVKVLFVDYGETVDVLYRHVKKIQKAFLHLPFQAVKCVISNIAPESNMMTNNEKSYLESKYLYKEFEVKIVYVSSAIWGVQLFIKGEDVGVRMVRDGYAVLHKKHFPDPKKSLLVD